LKKMDTRLAPFAKRANEKGSSWSDLAGERAGQSLDGVRRGTAGRRRTGAFGRGGRPSIWLAGWLAGWSYFVLLLMILDPGQKSELNWLGFVRIKIASQSPTFPKRDAGGMSAA
jgi:hypothetical protein